MTIARLAVRLYYVSSALGRRVPALGYALKQLNHAITGADIAWQAQIGPGLRLFHPTGVVVGKHVTIGSDCRMQQGVTVGGLGGDVASEGESPVLGDRVRIGPGARVFGQITVGHDVIIGANAVVQAAVPDFHVAVGVPATSRPRR